jgi:hypothetical protein
LPQAPSQQNPSEANPLAQAAAFIEACPVLSAHTPCALQVEAPEQAAGSSALVMATQAPPGAQVLHGPAHGPLQHTPPSTGFAQTHVPVASHVCDPEQPFGSGAFFMGRHVPVEQDWQGPPHAVEQQTP